VAAEGKIAFGRRSHFCVSNARFEVPFLLHGHLYLKGFQFDAVSRVQLYYSTLFSVY
jgi:hypothetical protein